MKNLQYYFLLLLIFLGTINTVNAQHTESEKPWIGRTYVVQQYGVRNHYFVRQADMALRNFDFEKAFFALENAVAQNPNSAEVLMHRATFRKTFGMLRESAQDLRIVNRMNPYLADLYGYHGPQGRLNLLDEPLKSESLTLDSLDFLNDYYRIWDRQYANDRIASAEMDGLDEAMRQIEEYEFNEALSRLDKVLLEYPGSGLAYDLKGMIYIRTGKLELAAQALSKAVALVPEFAIAWYNYARVEELQGNMDQAAVYYDRAIQLQEDLVKAHFDRARLHQSQGGYEKALDSYSEIVEKYGDIYSQAFLKRGVAKRQLGDFGGALVDYNHALEAYPDNPALLQSRGNLNLVFGFYHHAIQDYTKALEIARDEPSTLYNRGLAHFLIYDPVSACFDLQKSADLGHERAALKYTYFCGE